MPALRITVPAFHLIVHIRIRVWDLPLRLFHWSLLVLVLTSLLTAWVGGWWMTWHLRSGYALIALLLFRWVWGMCGGYHARFAHFVVGPRRVLAYLQGKRGPAHVAPLGHNPAGGWSVLALLSVLTLQVGSGLFANDEIFTQGPLAAMVSDRTSEVLTYYHTTIGLPLLYVLVGLHLAAVLYYALVERTNLVLPMLDGDKRVDAASAPNVVVSRDGWRQRLLAGALLAGGVAVALWLNWLGNH